MEPQTLPVSLLPTLIAIASAMGPAPMSQWPWDLIVPCVLGVLCLHADANLINDYFDFRHGVDQHVGPEGRLSGWTLGRGAMTPRQVLAEALACLTVALACGAYIAFRRGPEALWLALAGVAVLYSYTGPPLKLKYHALGEIAVFLVFGPLLMLSAGYVASGHFTARVAVLSLPIALATTAILMGNNMRDAQADRQAGVFTIAHIARGRLVRALYVAAELACVGLLAAYAVLGLLPRWLVACPLLLCLLIGPLKAIWRNQGRLDMVEATARFETILLTAVLLGIVASR
jgi:1,4-dihydroxy-2-naphthoate octaprenyltransferase